ncbi:uncharacterized protein F4812DRAFT_443726 [Daldinia caldariorum]|uniref:uncharacterized protein n=1 Tax=Daldinia caldariorum TaxID=326644 RepID=UPI0020087F1E|nr:uncharacterized protein F4812DRAFT_443726 [Daldinia caldariorum]KAI1464189.1 hypothetical protein F4812DRAFT_443726 [Daldinia caldariorum]
MPSDAGQPARRTEYTSIRWQNTLQGRLRNIMISNGRAAVRTMWYKRRYTAHVENPIWRYLPSALGEAYAIYIPTRVFG